MTVGLGVDGAGRLGWVGVVVDDDGFAEALLAPSLAELVASADAGAASRGEAIGAVGVDIPIGLVAAGRRSADAAAREFVGPRRSSVFWAPHRDVLDHLDQASANAHLAAIGMPKVSSQAMALMPRIRATARVAAVDDRVVEVFPEASFRQMAGRDLEAYKKRAAGALDRLALLAGATPPIRLPAALGPAGAVALDDLLDAAAAGWSARRVARGEAIALGDPDEVDPETGHRIAMWV